MTQGRHAAPKRALRDPAAKPVGGTRKAPRKSILPTLPVGRAGTEVTAAAVAPVAFLSAACVLGLGASSGEPASAETGRPADSNLLRPSAAATELVGRHRATEVQRVSTASTTAGQAGVSIPAAGHSTSGTSGSTATAVPSAPHTTAPTTEPTTDPTTPTLTDPTADPTPDPTDEPVIALPTTLPTALPTILPEVPLVP